MDIAEHELLREASNARLRLIYSRPLALHSRKDQLIELLFQATTHYIPGMKASIESWTTEANDLLLLSS